MMKLIYSIAIIFVCSFVFCFAQAEPSEGSCKPGTRPAQAEYHSSKEFNDIYHGKTEYPKSKVHNYNYELCWGVFAPVNTVACIQFLDKPCLQPNAAEVCSHVNKKNVSEMGECEAGAANKVYTQDEIDYCDKLAWNNILVNRSKCMLESGESIDGQD